LRVVVTGRHGQVVRSCSNTIRHGRRSHRRRTPELELTDSRTVEAAIAPLNPAVVMHAGGYTDTRKPNRAGPRPHRQRGRGARGRRLRRAAWRTDHSFVELYVFDGSSARPLIARTIRCPLGAYGKTRPPRSSRCGSAARSRHAGVPRWWFSPFRSQFLDEFPQTRWAQDEVLVVADHSSTRTRHRPRGRNPDHSRASDRGTCKPEYYGLFL